MTFWQQLLQTGKGECATSLSIPVRGKKKAAVSLKEGPILIIMVYRNWFILYQCTPLSTSALPTTGKSAHLCLPVFCLLLERVLIIFKSNKIRVDPRKPRNNQKIILKIHKVPQGPLLEPKSIFARILQQTRTTGDDDNNRQRDRSKRVFIIKLSQVFIKAE